MYIGYILEQDNLILHNYSPTQTQIFTHAIKCVWKVVKILTGNSVIQGNNYSFMNRLFDFYK